MSKSKYDIVFVAKDPGGTNAVLPVVKLAAEAIGGEKIALIGNGWAAKMSDPKISDVKFLSVSEDTAADRIEQAIGQPGVLVTSKCSGGGLGLDLAKRWHGKNTSTVVVSDFWGSRMLGPNGPWSLDKLGNEIPVDFVCVGDVADKDMSAAAWPSFDRDNIVVTGFAALDKYTGFDRQTVLTKARTALGLPLEAFVITYAGQGTHTSHALNELSMALNSWEANRPEKLFLIPRPHPRMKDNFPNEMQPWHEALARCKGATVIVDWCGQFATNDLTAASDAAVSMFSTALLEAAAMDVPLNISMLYPDRGEARLMEELGTKTSPMAAMGWSHPVGDQTELQMALATKDLLIEQQARKRKENLPVDGQNAGHIWEVVRAAMNASSVTDEDL